ncbi:MAG: hypothetical protein R3182_14870 [Draconibacterium sp.]|nr:hypothetical protein [Draconibacterium sp.]
MKLPKIKKLEKIIEGIRPDCPLTDEQIEGQLMLLMSSTPHLTQIITPNSSLLEDDPGMEAFVRRLDALTSLKITLRATLFIGLHIKTFGDAVIYAYYLHRKCEPDSVITLEFLVENIFPMGVLSDDQKSYIWENQKTSREEMRGYEMVMMGVDNLLDYKVTWEKEGVEA